MILHNFYCTNPQGSDGKNGTIYINDMNVFNCNLHLKNPNQKINAFNIIEFYGCLHFSNVIINR